MTVIPITKATKTRRMTTKVYRQTPSTKTLQKAASLHSYRIREIVPKYRDVDILCAVQELLQRTRTITSAQDVVDLFVFLAFEVRENFYALHLNSKNRILCLDQVSLGSLNASIVHPREVFSSALLSGAAAVIFVHNHPSGDPTPSKEDRTIQQRLCEVGELLGIRVLDHLVIGRGGRYVSLKEEASGSDRIRLGRSRAGEGQKETLVEETSCS